MRTLPGASEMVNAPRGDSYVPEQSAETTRLADVLDDTFNKMTD